VLAIKFGYYSTPVGGSAYEKPQSGCAFCGVFRRHILTRRDAMRGNSQGIRLPKAFLKNIDISENETVDVILQNDTIVMSLRAASRAVS
jgi:hypothetical protein